MASAIPVLPLVGSMMIESGVQHAAPLEVLDQVLRDAILHGPGRVHELELGVEPDVRRSGDIRGISTSGVCPMASRIDGKRPPCGPAPSWACGRMPRVASSHRRYGQPPAIAGRSTTVSVGADRRLQLLQVAHVLAVEVDVHEPVERRRPPPSSWSPSPGTAPRGPGARRPRSSRRPRSACVRRPSPAGPAGCGPCSRDRNLLSWLTSIGAAERPGHQRMAQTVRPSACEPRCGLRADPAAVEAPSPHAGQCGSRRSLQLL